jgi:hypothetical protein
MEAKAIPMGPGEFMANGKKYIVKSFISIERFQEYEKLAPQLTMGIGFDEMFTSLKKAYGYLNTPQPKPLDAGIIIHNLMNGIKGINDGKRVHPALKMAALVINREDEDPAKYDEKLMLDKINDWQAEGLDMMDFFDLSLSSIQGFNERLSQSSQEKEKKQKE